MLLIGLEPHSDEAWLFNRMLVFDPFATFFRVLIALAALVTVREEGLIDGIGLSNVSRRHLLRAVAQTEIVCVQNLFNLADQRSLDVLTECEARNIAFVPFCPLGLPGEVRHRLLADLDHARDVRRHDARRGAELAHEPHDVVRVRE